MNVIKVVLALTAIGIAFSADVFALERSECLERLKSVDERIASGNYPAQNVQIAQQARENVLQACAFIDEATFEQMMESFDELLPTGSEAEQAAAREVRRLENSAKRERQRAELAQEKALRASQQSRGTALPVSEVLKGPPTASSSFARYIDRDDQMYGITLLDWDIYEGRSRLLYVTFPSSEQARLPGAMHHYYVVSAGPGNSVSQYHVAGLPLGQTRTAGLRGGFDEVIFQWPTAAPDPGTRMERWSISVGERSSTGTGPMLPWFTRQWSLNHHFSLTTSDGNVLFVGRTPPSNDGAGVAWVKASPDGRILSKGTRKVDVGGVTAEKWIRTKDGGAAFLIRVSNFNDQGINTNLDTPLTANIDGFELKGIVASETRLLSIKADAGVAWESTALERSIIWQGLAELGQRNGLGAVEKAGVVTTEADLMYGAYDSVGSHSARAQSTGAIAAIDGGYGALIATNGPDSSQTGYWLVEHSANSKVTRTDLTAASGYLRGKFTMIASAKPNRVYLFQPGSGNSPKVIELDENRAISGYGELKKPRTVFERLLLADDAGVWIFGEGLDSGQFQKIWVERVDFWPATKGSRTE